MRMLACTLGLVFASALLMGCKKSEPSAPPSVPSQEASSQEFVGHPQPANGSANTNGNDSSTVRDNDLPSLLALMNREESEIRSLFNPSSVGGFSTDPPQPHASTSPGETASPLHNHCERACRAIASMQRATEGICRLLNDTDTRCVDAKDRTQRAIQVVRLAHCTCS